MGALLSEPVKAMVVERSCSETLAASAVTMQGWRKTHEDEHILVCQGAGTQEHGVFAVLDGHGGRSAASAASGALQELLLRIAKRGPLEEATAANELEDAFVEADARLRASLASEDRSGTTVVAAVVTRQAANDYCVQLAHAGDSRAVLRAGHRLVCSQDHKPGRDDERLRIQSAGGTVEHGPLGGGPLRVDGALAVSRALGDFHFKPVEVAPARCKVTAVPEVQTVRNCSTGDWLLLACDGVFDVMSNEEVDAMISSAVAKAAPGPVDGERVLADLLQTCLDRGSKDNCTACLVQLMEPGICQATSGSSRKLVQGGWETASREVKDKYAEFFETEGFQAEARAVQRAGGGTAAAPSPPGSLPPRDSSDHAPASSQRSGSGSMPTAGAQRQIVVLAKAMQAMRSSRTIQAAWRARRGNKEDDAGGQST